MTQPSKEADLRARLEQVERKQRTLAEALRDVNRATFAPRDPSDVLDEIEAIVAAALASPETPEAVEGKHLSIR